MFKIGDKVIVNHAKKCFPYAQMLARLMGFGNWRFGAIPLPCTPCTVVGKSFIPNSDTVAYGIDDGDRQFVIMEEGIVAVPSEKKYDVVYDLLKWDGQHTVIVRGTSIATARTNFHKSFTVGNWKREIISIEER